MAPPTLTAEDVQDRLGFARQRMGGLVALNGGDLPSADRHDRQQLVQEFFFHLVGAVEMLAQLVNEARSLHLDVEVVSIPEVVKRLAPGDALRAALEALYLRPKGNPFPSNPYSDEGVIYRIWNYRHQVTHRGWQQFNLVVTIGPAIDFGPGLRGRWREFCYRWNRKPDAQARGRAHFILDPREPRGRRTASTYSVPDELERMLKLISTRCERALTLI